MGSIDFLANLLTGWSIVPGSVVGGPCTGLYASVTEGCDSEGVLGNLWVGSVITKN